MVSAINCDFKKVDAQPGRLKASLSAVLSFLRGLPLFVARRPRTPLRVLCILAFDTVHLFRYSRRMSKQTLENLALLLDFGASANDFFDKSGFSRQEYRATRRLLEKAQIGTTVNEYIIRLREIENRRPSSGGDDQQHQKVQAYRESVVRLSLGMVAATAFGNLTVEEGIQAIEHDEDLEMLYRIVMLCQIIDDVLDLAKDTDNEVPSFLTAHTSPSQALILTSDAATRYVRGGMPASPHLFPFRMALLGMLALTKVAIMYGRWRLRLLVLRSWLTWNADQRASADTHL